MINIIIVFLSWNILSTIENISNVLLENKF